MDITRTLQKIIARFQTPQDAHGTLINAPDVARIYDGVDYSLPIMLPRALRDTLTKSGNLGRYLTESTRDTLRFQFDSPYRDNLDLPVDPVSEDPLREWNWATREKVLTNTHAAYQRNPIAHRGVKYMAAFVCGEGFNLTCKNTDVRAVLEAFIDDPDNAIREYEQQAVIDLQVDGELLLRWFEGNGQTVLVPQRPWECQYIRTEKGFFRRAVAYHFVRYLTEGDAPTGGQSTETEDVPAEQMLHVAINRHGYELRGRPELYVVLPWLRAYKDWLENRARQNYWRGALLWWVKVTTNASSAIAAVAARWARPPTPGSVAVTTANEEVSALTNPVGAGDASEDGRQMKIMAAVGMGLPEYMLSDGANANLASSKSQQLPALMTFGTFQRILTEQLWYPVFTRVLQNAIDAGDLPEEVEEQDADGDTLYDEPEDDAYDAEPTAEAFPPQQAKAAPTLPVMPEKPKGKPMMCKTLEAFDVSYEPIADKEPFTLAQALQIAVTNEWLSNESASREMGYDYAGEQKRIGKERREQNRQMATGERPMPPMMIPPGMEGDDDDDGNSDNREG